MNRSTLARFLRLAVMSCILLSCLAALQTPALAIAIYDAFIQESVSIPEPLPSGTSFSLLPGRTPISQDTRANAVATGAGVLSPPLTATALVSGFASGSGGFSNIFAYAIGEATLFNGNSTTVFFPLTVSFTRSLSTSTTGGLSNFAYASGAAYVTIDGALNLFETFSSCNFANPCVSFDSGSDTFLFALPPGSHSFEFSAVAVGHDSLGLVPESTPEPASLILLGTTMAGLGLARWKRRSQK